MYTQCPDCATVFRLTAEILRAAQGEVRCGVCSTTFSALENLSEKPFQPGTEAGPPVKPEDTITVEEVPGTENIEIAAPAATDEERAMEFHGNPADLDKLFVQMPQAEVLRFTQVTTAHEDLDRTDEYPIIVLEEDEPDQPEVIVLETPREPEPAAKPRILIPDEMRKGLEAEAAVRMVPVSSPVGFDAPDDSQADAPRRWPWAVGATVLALALAAQVVHSQRDELIRQPGVGPVLARAYALFGMPFATPTDLSAFELRQLGAANDTSAAGRLLLRASIVNRANFAQPFPLLRLALQDRYGTTLRVRDIEPADYLPGKDAPGLLDAGGRADAEIRVVDPGPDAVGFEMDVCLKVPGGVRCANQAATATP